jgi:hypothetical protein
MNKFLISIPKGEREGGRTTDSIKYNKDCADFICLEDGTIMKECRYCNLSLQCRQIDIGSDGKAIPMESHFLPLYDAAGNLMAQELFCTGMYDLRPYKERLEDDKVS